MTNHDDVVPAGMPAGPAEVAYWTAHEQWVNAEIMRQLRPTVTAQLERMFRLPPAPEPLAAACYTARAGFRVHVRPGCRCPRP